MPTIREEVKEVPAWTVGHHHVEFALRLNELEQANHMRVPCVREQLQNVGLTVHLLSHPLLLDSPLVQRLDGHHKACALVHTAVHLAIFSFPNPLFKLVRVDIACLESKSQGSVSRCELLGQIQVGSSHDALRCR